MNIKLKDGSILELEIGSNSMDAAKKISEGLARNVLAAKVNGEVCDFRDELSDGDSLNLLTVDSEGGLRTLRHTSAHIMAQAVKRLYPAAKLAIGPAIADGFYYDFDVETPFSPEDLEKIEQEMKKIIKEKIPLERFDLPRDEAIKLMTEMGEPYKVELIEDLADGELITFYKQGDFTDLCAGPHAADTSKLKAFKLTSATGAYWRGDSSRKMLCRIYGTAFGKKEELEAHLAKIEEAKKRDHRKLGRELDLFMLADEGPGFPFFLPKGMVLRNELEKYWHKVHDAAGYEEIKSPIILSEELWHTSGHWDHYQENMYFTKIDDGAFAIKPMNCPGGMLAYKRRPWSYKDLPMRTAELGLVHRHELSGALHGLMRVRCFTQDDAHIFMTPEQVEPEIGAVIDLIDEVYRAFGFKYHVELSTCPEKFIGTEEMRKMSEGILKNVLESRNMEYVLNPGDGAFYGPKIDFHLEDCLGRTWQCGTIQLDYQMPERFELEYTGADGEKHRPVMIHRVAFGSMERFIGILTEHFAGAFPTWLAPVQVKLLPITDRTAEYAADIESKLKALGVRVEKDLRSEKIGYKIREAQLQKVPYMLVLGDKEQESGLVAVRSRAGGDLGTMNIDEFVTKISEEISDRSID